MSKVGYLVLFPYISRQCFCFGLTRVLAADQEWLDAMNRERKKEQMDQVTYEIFEVIMDRLEKEWFDLVGNPPCDDDNPCLTRLSS